MAFPVRIRPIPQCPSCLRNHVWATFVESAAATRSNLQQQIRGKKKMPNNSATVVARLNQGIKTFGKKGALVPIERGRMRNQFFPQGMAEYVTLAELKTLKSSDAVMQRDYTYGVEDGAAAKAAAAAAIQSRTPFGGPGKMPIHVPPTPKVERITPERGVELIDIFVRPHIDFYRQPMPEEKEAVEQETYPRETTRSASSAAADLLGARMHAIRAAKSTKPRGIYGSVSTHDVLVAVRAAMADNDEAARVFFTEDDIEFVDLAEQGENEPGRVKHVGDFTVEIRVKGADTAIRRSVRVIPQDA